MNYPVLYRKRLIPEECVCLKNDEIIYFSESESRIVTKWHALKPKKDLHHGFSAYFCKEGFKISKFYCENGDLLYWYCDIIDSEFNTEENTYVATDLLADVIIYPDGFVKVVDLDEITEAYDKGLLSLDLMKASISRLSNLLDIVYSEKFEQYKDFLNQFEM